MTEQPSIWQVIFTALVSGTVVSAMLGLIFHQRLKSIEARLNEELQRNVEIFRTMARHAIRPGQTRIQAV
jgi:hypothetical protein